MSRFTSTPHQRLTSPPDGTMGIDGSGGSSSLRVRMPRPEKSRARRPSDTRVPSRGERTARSCRSVRFDLNGPNRTFVYAGFTEPFCHATGRSFGPQRFDETFPLALAVLFPSVLPHRRFAPPGAHFLGAAPAWPIGCVYHRAVPLPVVDIYLGGWQRNVIGSTHLRSACSLVYIVLARGRSRLAKVTIMARSVRAWATGCFRDNQPTL